LGYYVKMGITELSKVIGYYVEMGITESSQVIEVLCRNGNN